MTEGETIRFAINHFASLRRLSYALHDIGAPESVMNMLHDIRREHAYVMLGLSDIKDINHDETQQA